MTPLCDTLRSLYISELRNLFSAEVLFLRCLPTISKGATTPALRQAFSSQIGQTRIHVSRLERIFEDLSETVSDETCEAINALVGEVQRYLEADGDNDVRDAALIVAARKIHGYKAVTCESTRALALCLSDTGAADRLKATHDEERAADEEFARIAESSVNVNAGNRSKAKAEFDVSIF